MRKIKLMAALLILLTLPACSGFLITSNTENFKESRKDIKSVVFMEPDMYLMQGREKRLRENSNTIAMKETITKAYGRYGKKLGVEVKQPGLINAQPGSTLLLKLKAEIQRHLFVFAVDESLTGYGSRKESKLLSPDFYLSPEYSQLSQQAGTPYFYYTLVLSRGDAKRVPTDIYIINVLADVNKGTVQYTEIKKVPLALNKVNMGIMIYDSLYLMLN